MVLSLCFLRSREHSPPPMRIIKPLWGTDGGWNLVYKWGIFWEKGVRGYPGTKRTRTSTYQTRKFALDEPSINWRKRGLFYVVCNGTATVIIYTDSRVTAEFFNDDFSVYSTLFAPYPHRQNVHTDMGLCIHLVSLLTDHLQTFTLNAKHLQSYFILERVTDRSK